MKNIILPFLLFSVISILEMSCAKSKDLQIQEGEVPIIILSKSRCRGYCPAYTLEIFESNKVKYIGVANVDVLGKKIFKIKKEEVVSLKEAFEKSEFKDFENKYLSKYMDIPKIILTYNGHQIEYHENSAPDKIKALSDLVEVHLPKRKIGGK